MVTILIIAGIIGLFYLAIKLETSNKAKSRMNEEKISLLHKLCDKGDGQSCYLIGREYRFTKGGYYEHNLDMALKYFKKACELKYGTGCDYAAMTYLDKDFYGYNVDKAIEYYKLGMTKDYDYEHVQGHPRHLAEVYINLKNDIPSGAKLLSKVCDEGDDFACGNALGYFGSDMDKNTRDKVLTYYMKHHPEKCQKCRFMDKWSS